MYVEPMNIEEYLSDIESRLGEVPEARRTEILRELRSHLCMSRNGAVEELQMLPDDAERAAINMMGSSQVLSEDILRRETGIESKSIWRMALLPGAAMLVAHLAPWAAFWSGYSELIEWSMALNYAVLALLAISVWKSRKWLVGPMGAWLAASFVCVTLAFIVVPPDLRNSLPREVAIESLERKIIEAELALTGDLSLAKATGGYRAPFEYSSHTAIRMPYLPFSIPTGESTTLTQRIVPTDSEARTAWAKYGPQLLRDTQQRHEEVVASYDGWLRSRSMERWLAPLPHVAASFSFEICVFTVVNGATLLLVGRRRRRRSEAKGALA